MMTSGFIVPVRLQWWAAALLAGACHPRLAAAVLDSCEGTTTADDVVDGANLTGKLAIVTGGDSELGYPLVRALARQGAHVVIASHNLPKCERAAARAAHETGGIVDAMSLDLSKLAAVRAFAQEYLAKYGPRLHYLVHNAGIAGNPPSLSADGYQLLFQVNYLSPFLLTELLLPALRHGGLEGLGASRVVNVASSEHSIACEAAGWQDGCMRDWRYLPPPQLPDMNVTVHYPDGSAEVRPIELYGFTKALLIQHAAELARRETVVEAYSLTPGWVNTTLTRGIPLNSTIARRKCAMQVPSPCPFTPDEGAAILAFCAVAAQGGSGSYLSRLRSCHADRPTAHGFRPDMGGELYRRTLIWAGLATAMAEGEGEEPTIVV